MSIQNIAKIVRQMREKYKETTLQTIGNDVPEAVAFIADFNFLCGYILAQDQHDNTDMQAEVPEVPEESPERADTER